MSDEEIDDVNIKNNDKENMEIEVEGQEKEIDEEIVDQKTALDKEKEAEKKRKLKKVKDNQRKKRQNLLKNKDIGSKIPGRLIITHMELENFKSYAGVKTIGPFHKCFSAVVGPNGSGKSNVIDAMLFVFGKRAKKLRLKKVSQLIHKSSEHPGCTFARVTVFFKNIIDLNDTEENFDTSNMSKSDLDEGYKTIEDTSFSVTRYAYDTNKSEYYLGDKKETFTTIYDTLIQRGVDLHQNRFLILQGEVEQISLMKPKKVNENDDEGLLEYLEDIIGTNKYVDAIEDKEAEVEEIDVERTEKLNLIKASETEVDRLEESKNDALKYLEKERKLLYYRNLFVAAQVKIEQDKEQNIRKELEILHKEREDIVQQSVQDETSQTNSIKDKITELEKEIETENKNLNKIMKTLKQHESDFVTFERKEIKLKEDIEHAQKGVKLLEKKKKKEDKVLKDSNKLVEEHTTDVEKYTKLVEKTTTKLETEEVDLESKLKNLTAETTPYREELEELQKQLAPLKSEQTKVQNDMNLIQTEIDIVESGVTEANSKLQEAKTRQNNITEKSKSIPNEISTYKNEVKELKETLQAFNVKTEDKKAKEKLLEKKIQNKRNKLEKSRFLKETATDHEAICSNLLRAQAKEGMKFDLIGRAGDLAKIDKKYDIAISTACGSINFLVTKTADGAEKCIQYLKKHRLGRASFASLDKMNYLVKYVEGTSSQNKDDKKVKRLFDLIDFSDSMKKIEKVFSPSSKKEAETLLNQVKAVFYLGLKDTLVAPDIDVATDVAFGDKNSRNRVVTLQGQLIEASGAMTGGGKRVNKGFMKLIGKAKKTDDESATDDNTILSREEVKAEEQKIESNLDKLNQIRAKRQGLEKDSSALESQISQKESKVKTLQVENDSFKSELEQIEVTINMWQAKTVLSAEAKGQKVKFEAELKKLAKGLKKKVSESKTLEEGCAELEEKILNAGGPELKEKKALVQKLREDLKKYEEELLSNTVSLESLQKTIEKSTLSLEGFTSDLEASLEEKEKKTSELNSITTEAEKLKETLRAIEQENQEQNKLLLELRTNVKSLKDKQNEVARLVVDVDNKIASFDADLTKLSQKKSSLVLKTEEFEKEFNNFLPEHLRKVSPKETAEAEDENSNELPNDNMSIASESEASVNELLEEKFDKYVTLTATDEDLETEQEDIKDTISKVSKALTSLKKALGSNLNLASIDDYFKQREVYEEKLIALSEITQKRDVAQDELDVLRKQRLNEFMKGFQEISLSLKMLYQMLTLGGDADLDLVDSLDPFSEGITFSVRPPKKSWKDIRNLSGGEKTLSSLALVFALHKYERNALYVMDEIDAALDFRNVSIVGNYLKEQTKDAQFIVISLRNNMFELADRLVGIYKTNNATKSITIDPQKIVDKINNKQKDKDKEEVRPLQENTLNNVVPV